MLIMDHVFEDGSKFEGQFTVTNSVWRLNRYHDDYLVVDLTDISGTIRAYGWPSRYNGAEVINSEDVIYLKGTITSFSDYWQVNAEEAEVVNNMNRNLSWLVSAEEIPSLEILTRFSRALDEITLLPLKCFIRDVFSDTDLKQKFMRVPASCRHHHSYLSGTLDHSIECVDVVRVAPGLSKLEREIAIVAALLHDIGKTRTNTDKGLSQEGLWTHHNCFTLEVLGSALSRLDKTWPTGAGMLRHIWSSLHNGSTQPRNSLSGLVRYADQFSAERERERVAFDGLEQWKTWQKDQHGVNRLRMRSPQPELRQLTYG